MKWTYCTVNKTEINNDNIHNTIVRSSRALCQHKKFLWITLSCGRQPSPKGQNKREAAGHFSTVAFCTCFIQWVLRCFVYLLWRIVSSNQTSANRHGLDSPSGSILSTPLCTVCSPMTGGEGLYIFKSHWSITQKPAEFHFTWNSKKTRRQKKTPLKHIAANTITDFLTPRERDNKQLPIILFTSNKSVWAVLQWPIASQTNYLRMNLDQFVSLDRLSQRKQQCIQQSTLIHNIPFKTLW